jgi:hypothetical protein
MMRALGRTKGAVAGASYRIGPFGRPGWPSPSGPPHEDGHTGKFSSSSQSNLYCRLDTRYSLGLEGDGCGVDRRDARLG